MNTVLHLKDVAPIVSIIALLACDGATVGVSPDLQANVIGRDDGTVTLPMRIVAQATWAVPGASAADCPNLIDPQTNELFTAVGSGVGTAEYLGRFEIAKLDHPTINLCPLIQRPPAPLDPSGLFRNGEFELVAADGSAIAGSYQFFFAPEEQGGFFTMLTEEGTGRFVGASGRLEVSFEKSGVLECTDILCLDVATLDPFVLEGTMTLPRP